MMKHVENMLPVKGFLKTRVGRKNPPGCMFFILGDAVDVADGSSTAAASG